MTESSERAIKLLRAKDRRHFIRRLETAEFFARHDIMPLTFDSYARAIILDVMTSPEFLEGATNDDFSVAERFDVLVDQWGDGDADGSREDWMIGVTGGGEAFEAEPVEFDPPGNPRWLGVAAFLCICFWCGFAYWLSGWIW